MRKLSDIGDTIVEVMIVLAVLGLAIGLSYSTAERSLLATRAAEENSQATEYLQGQIEQLRALANDTAPTDPNDIYIATPFCVLNGAVFKITNLASPPPQCQPPQTYYNLSIAYNGSGPPSTTSPTSSTFTLTATWPDVQGQGQDTVTFVYRLYPS